MTERVFAAGHALCDRKEDKFHHFAEMATHSAISRIAAASGFRLRDKLVSLAEKHEGSSGEQGRSERYVLPRLIGKGRHCQIYMLNDETALKVSPQPWKMSHEFHVHQRVHTELCRWRNFLVMTAQSPSPCSSPSSLSSPSSSADSPLPSPSSSSTSSSPCCPELNGGLRVPIKAKHWHPILGDAANYPLVPRVGEISHSLALSRHFRNLLHDRKLFWWLPHGAMTMECIPPLSDDIREGLVRQYIYPPLQNQALKDENNLNFLLQPLLGASADEVTVEEEECNTSLRDRRAYLPFFARHLGTQGTCRLAAQMGIALATVHWACRLDACNVKFRVGAMPDMDKVASGSGSSSGHGFAAPAAEPDLDFGFGIWMLDFGDVNSFTLTERAPEDKLLRCVMSNKMFIPRPNARERCLWLAFRDAYFAMSEQVIRRDGHWAGATIRRRAEVVRDKFLAKLESVLSLESGPFGGKEEDENEMLTGEQKLARLWRETGKV